MDAISPLGDLIRNRRQALGLTQEELAEAVRVHVSSVISWESGEHYPKRKIGVLEKTLGVSLRDPAPPGSEADLLRAEAAELRETVVSQARLIAQLMRSREQQNKPRAGHEQDDADPERGRRSLRDAV